jgi:hypothetical protein
LSGRTNNHRSHFIRILLAVLLTPVVGGSVAQGEHERARLERLNAKTVQSLDVQQKGYLESRGWLTLPQARELDRRMQDQRAQQHGLQQRQLRTLQGARSRNLGSELRQGPESRLPVFERQQQRQLMEFRRNRLTWPYHGPR